ncbi:rCG26785 [Rattus norvegicus]|uniref:RCG26785 n=1 Tax=Rattus norvegicus TaxID=10116 RepID=A6HM93_RAT|nr:rCG26785 [Rattus norvegicus]
MKMKRLSETKLFLILKPDLSDFPWKFRHLIKISRLQTLLLDERRKALHCSGS